MTSKTTNKFSPVVRARAVRMVEHEIPHQARVILQPDYGRVRVSFLNADDAKAFRDRFIPRLH